MRIPLLLCLACWLTACGASAPSMMSYAPERASMSAAPAPPEAPKAYEESEYEAAEDAAPAPAAGGESSFGPPAPSGGTAEPVSVAKPSPGTAAAPTEQPIIVYSGYLRLRVKRLLETIDAITTQAEKLGGYVESMTQDVVIVRVPVGAFEAALAHFEALGTILQREVKSLDVTARFTDTTARLAVARDARTRLLALLQATQDVQQRLRILEEVKRLSEQIETMESMLGTLRKLADFSTITLALEPVVAQSAGVQHRSPFGWVRALLPHHTTLPEGKSRIAFTVPRGFVLFEEDDAWRAQAADTSTLRAGVVKNEPRGDAAFWMAAIDHELVGRDEEPVLDGVSGGLHWRIYRSRDALPRYYLIGVLAQEADLLVLEGFLPEPVAYDRHREAIVSALGGFGAK
jgi:hypothetical protein